MTEAGPARRKVESPRAEEDSSGRRGCMLIGAILGIGAGAIVALFALPPLFGSFFGSADVYLDETYEAEGRTMRVVRSERVPGDDGELYPGVWEVELEVQANRTWLPAPGDFTLELDGMDDEVAALEPDPARPETSLDFPLGQERSLVLRFPGTERRDVALRALHVDEPPIQFFLQPGSRD